jgi:hypothetical protein
MPPSLSFRSSWSLPTLLAGALMAWATLTPPLRAGETRDLLILAGQSNAVGYDALAPELLPDTTDQKVLFWFRVGDPPPDAHDSSSGSKWTTLRPQPKGNPIPSNTPPEQLPPNGKGRQYGNFKSPEGGFGPEIGLCRALQKQEPSRALAVVKAAFSGTGIRKDWDPQDPGPAGACYRALRDELLSAIASAAQREITLRPRAILWVQGESDSNANDAPHYASALTALLEQLRRDLNAPALPAFLAINVHFGNDRNAFVPQIIEAQKSVATQSGLARYIDTEGAETLLPSRTHFTTEGTLEVGRRFAEALLAWEKERPLP